MSVGLTTRSICWPERTTLLQRFAAYFPEWEALPAVDWVEHTQSKWPARAIGERLFLAPVWNRDPTPPGRERVIHNPGLASGTGEHPCTKLAMIALEQSLRPGAIIADIGAGSGILSVAALRLGASTAIGLDTDEAALAVARENFASNGFTPTLVAGAIDCLAAGSAHIAIANINASVLLSLFDDFLRITRPGGTLILTGFTGAEAGVLQQLLPGPEVSGIDEWRCLKATLSRDLLDTL